MKPKILPGDTPEARYQAQRIATALNLRKYYNECVAVMAKEEAGEISMDKALDKFLKLDAKWAQVIVDDLAPKKNILEV